MAFCEWEKAYMCGDYQAYSVFGEVLQQFAFFKTWLVIEVHTTEAFLFYGFFIDKMESFCFDISAK